MIFLGIDAGSSSVKARLFRNGRAASPVARIAYPTHHDGLRVEADGEAVLAAVARAVASVSGAKRADLVGLSVMSPAWVAMDRRGRAITPIVTHQDRRSVAEARELERRVGEARHLRLAGNRPFPGSISSTTCAWFLRHYPRVMGRADLVGHLNTFLHRRITSSRVIDPSNASFTGLYLTCRQSGWSEELCAAAGISASRLPEVVESNAIGGKVTPEAARAFGLRAGVPVLAGMIDTGAAMMVTPCEAGQLFHMCGSTDVLAAVCERARPNRQLLTRALGVGRKWLSVSTMAAAGSAIDWVKSRLFSEMTDEQFHRFAAVVAARPVETSVRFDPCLAGDRASIEQRTASISGLTLAATRRDILGALLTALAEVSAGRLALLAQAQPRFLPTVFVSGGGKTLARVMHRRWAGKWRFRSVSEASLVGLERLSQKAEVRRPKSGG
jgi:xylulokinase